MAKRNPPELSLPVYASTEEVQDFIRAIDGIGNRNDSLSVEVSKGDDGSGVVMILDGEGFPLFILTIVGEP